MVVGTFINGLWFGRCVRCDGRTFRIEGVGLTTATEVAAQARQGDLAWHSRRARHHCLGCAHLERWAHMRSDEAHNETGLIG